MTDENINTNNKNETNLDVIVKTETLKLTEHNNELQLIIVGGELTRDTDMFTKMDTFAIVKYNGKEYKSQTDHGSGKSP